VKTTVRCACVWDNSGILSAQFSVPVFVFITVVPFLRNRVTGIGVVCQYIYVPYQTTVLHYAVIFLHFRLRLVMVAFLVVYWCLDT